MTEIVQCSVNPHNAQILLNKPWKPKGFVQIEIIINFLANSFRFILIPMLWVYCHYKYLDTFSTGPFYTSASDVYRRQILSYKDGPRAERVNCADHHVGSNNQQ